MNDEALAAYELLRRFKCAGPPVHVAEMMDEMGIVYTADASLKRAYVRLAADGKREFVYNPDRPVGDIRVDAGHELGHVVLKHQLHGQFDRLFASGKTRISGHPDEISASLFDLYLLTPLAWVQKAICCDGVRIMGDLAGKFGVNYSHMSQAVRHYRLSHMLLNDAARLERYLRSDVWRQKREDVLSRRPECERCGCSRYARPLHVHHLSYRRLGCEWESDLAVLCDDHHLFAHGREQKHPGQQSLFAA